MSTLEDALAVQKQQHILRAPTIKSKFKSKVVIATTSTAPTLNITLENNTSSSNCWAYITGLDLNKNNAVFILQSDGVTPYYPASPSSTGSSFTANCHIPLGAPGTSKTVTIPQLAGGRIWLSKDAQITFLLNPGPALVEPSVTNPSDPNYNLSWSFAEFTYNSSQLFANITYVDFVGLPIALTLENTAGQVQSVPGIPSDGLDTVCSLLAAQDAQDGAGWSKLVVKAPSGANLRALSPNSGIVMDNGLLLNYYQPYVAAVWAKYAAVPLAVDTQNTWGTLVGTVDATTQLLTFPDAGAFPQPSTADVFSCSTGAFGSYPDNTEVMGNLTARLAAALNRSTLLANASQPAQETVAEYYQEAVTNHYARIVHAVCPDGKGYAFPYDDVAADDAQNVAGTVSDGSPEVFTVSFGGLGS